MLIQALPLLGLLNHAMRLFSCPILPFRVMLIRNQCTHIYKQVYYTHNCASSGVTCQPCAQDYSANQPYRIIQASKKVAGTHSIGQHPCCRYDWLSVLVCRLLITPSPITWLNIKFFDSKSVSK